MPSMSRTHETARVILAAHISRHGMSTSLVEMGGQWSLAFSYAKIGDEMAREMSQGPALESLPSGQGQDAEQDLRDDIAHSQ